MTSRYHGFNTSSSQQSFLTERAICILERFFFPDIFVGPRFVEIQKFFYHGIES